MSISNEQVRIALKVWYQDDEYDPSKGTLADMRAALEAAVGDAPSDKGWTAVSYERRTRHGLFSIFKGADTWHAIRAWAPRAADECTVEQLGGHPSADAARATCDARIAELDAAAAPEQVEACR